MWLQEACRAEPATVFPHDPRPAPLPVPAPAYVPAPAPAYVPVPMPRSGGSDIDPTMVPDFRGGQQQQAPPAVVTSPGVFTSAWNAVKAFHVERKQAKAYEKLQDARKKLSEAEARVERASLKAEAAATRPPPPFRLKRR